MVKKVKKSAKSKPAKRAPAKPRKSGAAKKRPIRKKKPISIRAKAVAKRVVAIRASVMKTSEELEGLRQRFAASISASASVAGACFFKDSSGGPDQCIPATQEDCKSEGGVWTPGNCPN